MKPSIVVCLASLAAAAVIGCGRTAPVSTAPATTADSRRYFSAAILSTSPRLSISVIGSTGDSATP